jgi:hypothetical protein
MSINECPEIFANSKLMFASGGNDYKMPYEEVIIIHEMGDIATFDVLVRYFEFGLFSWTCKYFEYTQEQYTAIKKIPELFVIGACFLRYKIIFERLYGRLSITYMFNQNIQTNRVLLPLNIEKVYKLQRSNYIEKVPEAERIIPESFTNPLRTPEGYDAYYQRKIKLDDMIDRIQCMIILIIKYNGLPDTFAMDRRIYEGAFNTSIWSPLEKLHGFDVGPLLIPFTFFTSLVVMDRLSTLFDSLPTFTNEDPYRMEMPTYEDVLANLSDGALGKRRSNKSKKSKKSKKMMLKRKSKKRM